ncbi:OmpH family outer membrane protein [Dysgonomonadaceae bacterium zrk40]|nr:OmpH family outer membrane protein [Dysgonomonadaceae bacterium zrk40]
MLATTAAYAQQMVSVAYVNSEELLEAFPEKKLAVEQLVALNENYKKELELMQSEYNKKYSDYITYQASLAENIKLRRMQELTELENRIQQFMELAQQDIEHQEQGLLDPLREKIREAIHAVGLEHRFTVIYDLADEGIAFVSPEAVDANPLVRNKLGIN